MFNNLSITQGKDKIVDKKIFEQVIVNQKVPINFAVKKKSLSL